MRGILPQVVDDAEVLVTATEVVTGWIDVAVFVAPDLARERGRAVDPVDDDAIEAVEDGLEVGVELAQLGRRELTSNTLRWTQWR